MEGLSMETVARYGNCLLQMFRPFIAFETIENNVRLHIIGMTYWQLKKKRG
jgi:hypothetical protein